MEEAPAELCGESGMQHNIRAKCEEPKGHVKDITRASWHHGTADITQEQRTNLFESITTTHEDISWAPNYYELPGRVRESLRKLDPEA